MSDTRQPNPMNRRTFLKRGLVLTMILGGGAGLLQACASAPTAAPTPAPAQQPAAAPTATTAAAPKPAAAPTATAAPAAVAAPAATVAPQPAATTAPAAKPAVQQVLNVALDRGVPHVNPLNAIGEATSYVTRSTFSTLTLADPEKTDFVPELAESWKIAPDGSSYTFSLRKDAKWHDGKPVTARDVAFTYKLGLNGATGTTLAGALALIKGAADFTAGKSNEVPGIVVVDDQTIRFDMEFPNGLFLYQTSTPRNVILPEHILGSVPPGDLQKHRFFVDAPIGSGAFKFVKNVPDQYIEVVANPDYYFGKPKLERILYRIFKSTETMEVALGREDVELPIFDGGMGPGTLYQKIIADNRFKVVGAAGQVLAAYGWNLRKDYLKDPRIHQALLHALDRKKLVERFNSGNGTIFNSFMVQSWYQKPEWASLYLYDPAKAKALLKEAGWDSNREVRVNFTVGKPPEVKARYAAEQQMLADVGFKVAYDEMDPPVWVKRFYETYEYEMVTTHYGTFPDPDGFLSFFMASKSRNPHGIANPELDKQIERGRRSVDQAERAKIYQAINEEMLKVLPITPLFLQNAWYLFNRKLSAPIVSRMTPATGLSNVPTAKTFTAHSDYLMFHQEQWEMRAP